MYINLGYVYANGREDVAVCARLELFCVWCILVMQKHIPASQMNFSRRLKM